MHCLPCLTIAVLQSRSQSKSPRSSESNKSRSCSVSSAESESATSQLPDTCILQIIHGVHQAIEHSTSKLEQQTLTLDLLAQLILRYAENPPDLDKLGTEIQPVHRVRDYLEEHADREISLEQLAQIVKMRLLVYCKTGHLDRTPAST